MYTARPDFFDYKISQSLSGHLVRALQEILFETREQRDSAEWLRMQSLCIDIGHFPDVELDIEGAEIVDRALSYALDKTARGEWFANELATSKEAKVRKKASDTFQLKAAQSRLHRLAGDLPGGRLASEVRTRWTCKACDNEIEVLVPVLAPPTCSRHTGGGRQMVPKEDQK
jgi:hypothetical protein